eukprot:4831369-Alexandrium_andersonii.AAC.1
MAPSGPPPPAVSIVAYRLDTLGAFERSGAELSHLATPWQRELCAAVNGHRNDRNLDSAAFVPALEQR